MAAKKQGKEPDSGVEAMKRALDRATDEGRALGLDTDSAGGYVVPKQVGGPPKPRKPTKKK